LKVINNALYSESSLYVLDPKLVFLLKDPSSVGETVRAPRTVPRRCTSLTQFLLQQPHNYILQKPDKSKRKTNVVLQPSLEKGILRFQIMASYDYNVY
jgi:hypothetical protein